jgi:3-deoxy-7-phosphoheptulonate synthase
MGRVMKATGRAAALVNDFSPGVWTPESWRSRPGADVVPYGDGAAVDEAVRELRTLPPIVTSWEIERLRAEVESAQRGEKFVLQGGDCAETFEDCNAQAITSKVKILLQMSLVLIHGSRKPVIRVGRFAGQYAKPRSSATETRSVRGDAVTLPSYFGDLFNGPGFSAPEREPDPGRMLRGYTHSAMTLNFVRALVDGGFADLHHPEYWDLSFLRHASLSPERRDEYERMTRNLADGLRFMEVLGEKAADGRSRAEFFTSHEGLNLHYESAQTRTVPRRPGHYCLTTHLPWIGDRTRTPGGAHVEFFRGVRNPLGVKIGPTATPDDVTDLCDILNPMNEPGKLLLILRLGAKNVERLLAPIVRAVTGAKKHVLWMCDPMHANGIVTTGGIKTRSFDDVRTEIEASVDMHQTLGTCLGGVHFEMTGEDVTECVGGASGVREEDLSSNYATLCDPRLNYQQAIELAFLLARRLRGSV